MPVAAELPVSRIVPLTGAFVAHVDDAVVIVTAARQHQASAEAAFDLDGRDGTEGRDRVLNVRLEVECGELGLGWYDSTGAEQVARATVAANEAPVDVALVVPGEHVGGRLVFDNAGGDDQPAVAIIEKIEIQVEDDRLDENVVRMFESYSAAHLPKPDEIAELESHAEMFTKERFLAMAPNRSILQNFANSIWEFANGKTELTSYPWNISLPVADLCNARCNFCTSWLEGRKVLDLDKLDMFEPVLRNALFIGLVGHGEPLAHPRFDELCDRLEAMCDPISSVYTITNGALLDKWRDHVERIRLHSYSVSLNAATAETHERVMGLGADAFPRIVDSIGRLIELGKQPGKQRNVYITMVVTQQNIAEIPAFIELGNRLGVTEIWLRSLLPQSGLIPGLNYHELPPYLLPDFEQLRRSAIAAIQASQVPVQADPSLWGQKIFSEALEEQIRLNPPPFIPREQALRDRDLRHRNQFLYTQKDGVFRGQRLESGATSEVRWVNGELAVLTPSGPGAYAAGIQVPYPAAAGRLRIDVDAECGAGCLGFGLLDKPKNAWLSRAMIAAGSAPAATLEAEVAGQPVELIVFNGGEGVPARGNIRKTLVSVDGKAARPIGWETLTIHNCADPLDDGTNPLGRLPRFACKAVYYNLYVNEMFYRVNPCCYLQQVPGFQETRLDGDMTFIEAWNSPGMVELRRRLVEGPLYGACVRCPEKW